MQFRKLKHLFIRRCSIASAFFVAVGSFLYSAPFSNLEFWRTTEEREAPKASEIWDGPLMKERVTKNTFRRLFVSEFGRIVSYLGIALVCALSILSVFGALIKHKLS